MSDPSVIDPKAHDRLREWGGPKLLRQMLRLFLENSGERMEQIAHGLEEGTATLVEIGAHALKSSAANVGATAVNELSARMEQLASEQDLDGAGELHEGLVMALAAAEERLRELEKGLER